jgi:hypothetical protein
VFENKVLRGISGSRKKLKEGEEKYRMMKSIIGSVCSTQGRKETHTKLW